MKPPRRSLVPLLVLPALLCLREGRVVAGAPDGGAEAPAPAADQGLVELGEDEAVLRRPIRFVPGSTRLTDESIPVVQALCHAVQDDPGVHQLIIEVSASGEAAAKIAAQRIAALQVVLTRGGIRRRLLKLVPGALPGEDAIQKVALKRGHKKKGN